MFRNYPSHSKEKCPIQGCDKKIRKDRMSDHLKNKHDDTPDKLAGQQKIAEFFLQKTSLSDFFVHKSTQAEKIQSEKTDIPSRQQVANAKGLLENEKSVDREEGATSLESQEGATSLESQEGAKSLKAQKSGEHLEPQDLVVESTNFEVNLDCGFLMWKVKHLGEFSGELNSYASTIRNTICAIATSIQEQRKIALQLRNMRETAEQKNSISTLNKVQKPESETLDIANMKYGIPSEIAFKKFFQGHRRDQDQVPITTLPEESSLAQEMEDDDDEMEKIEIIDSSSSTVAQKESLSQTMFKRFKRRKISSPSVNLSVSERLVNIHEDVLVVHEAVKKVSEKVSELSISEQVGQKFSESKIRGRGNTKSLEEETEKISDAKLVLVGSATCVSDLLKYADGICVNPDQPDMFICRCCYSRGKVDGSFNYDVSLGENFRDSALPREFRNLKSHIVTHLKTKAHIAKCKEAETSNAQEKLMLKRQYRVGMILGRQAYKILKCGDSHLQYETDVVVLKEQGCDVGNLNHSRMFVAEFQDSVHDCLMKKIQKLVNEPLPATGRPTPISVIADKLTPNRRTLQIVGFHGYVSNKIQSLVAGVPALSGGDGLSVTRCLRNGLSSLEIPANTLSSRIVGGAFDGEYFHLGVDSNLLKMLLVSEEAKKWYTFQWDVAHIIELAEKDCMKDSACESVKQVISTISEVSKSFSHGKSFRELVEEANNETEDSEDSDECFYSEIEKVKARVPEHFSDTRFATYSSVVIDKWLNNYPLYYKIMNREGKDTLDKINNAPFVFSCGGLCDVYTVVGNLSNAVQKPNIPCWEIETIMETHINMLEAMSDTLDPSTLKVGSISDSNVLPTLASMTKQIAEKNEYKGCPLLTKVNFIHSTRASTSAGVSHCENVEDALKTAAKPVRSLTQIFITKFKERMSEEKKKNEILSDVGALFDITRIIKLDSVEPVKKHLEKYSDLAKLTENLSDDVKLDDIVKEYDLFIKRVKDIAPKFLHKPPVEKSNKDAKPPKVKIVYPDRYDQIDLYKKILETPDLYKDIPNILHLALTGLCRTHCEAVVEGMGSVLCLNNEKRTTLNPKTVQGETVIRWQGPHPGKGASKLIEESLDRHFKGRDNWHFVTKSDKANHYMGSKVINRINITASQADKISFG